jgi:phospholipid/cholesterol/gamma-HCH transport system substrate-binding protein
MSTLLTRGASLARVVAAVVVLLLVGAVALVALNHDDRRYVTVDFTTTNSLYEGSDVKILGVAVGRVESVTPKGEVVRARISYDSKYRLPADVKAVIVSPSIVGDRFVQLAPAYSGGQALPDRAHLSVDRSAVPVELDQIYESLDDLSVALGPKGANKDGALSDLVDDTAGQLDGQGAQLNTTIKNFSKLSTTLSNNKDELFGSVREVSEFVELLESNDTAVRAFFDSTAAVSNVLEGERDDLAGTLEALSLALVDVNTLVRENRGALKGNVDNLEEVARVLGKRKAELEEITTNAPTALSNVALTYNEEFGTLDNRSDILDLLGGVLDNPVAIVCNVLADPIPEGEEICNSLADIIDGILPDLGGLLPRSAVASQEPDPMHESLDEMLAVR